MTTDIELPPLSKPLSGSLSFFGAHDMQAYARTAIEADRRLRAVPGDMVLVPREITDDMVREWDFQAGQIRDRRVIWKSIIAAAPTAAAPAGGADEVPHA